MSTSIPIDYLPPNVLTLSGYDFFQFIRTTLGEPEANLLLKIAVKTTSSFILIDDPLDIFYQDVDDEELDELKQQLCFRLKNERFLIKPGVLSGFRSLKEALKNKLTQQGKNQKKRQQHQSLLFDTNGSMVSTRMDTNNSTTAPSVTMSLGQHRKYIVELIQKWCKDNKENFNFTNFQLEEDVDFTLNIESNRNSIENASIKCKCGRLISLAMNQDKIQISNYYKHLQSTACTLMKELRNAERRKELEEQQRPIISVKTNTEIDSSSLSANETFDEVSETPAASRIASTDFSTQSQNGGKRRIATQSQSNSSTKKRRS